jgi:hypothetical protein
MEPQQQTEQKLLVSMLESEKWAMAALDSMMNDKDVGAHIKNNEPLQGLMKGFFLMGVDIARSECQNAVIDTVNAYLKIPQGAPGTTTPEQEVKAIFLSAVNQILKVGTKNVTMETNKKSNLIYRGN